MDFEFKIFNVEDTYVGVGLAPETVVQRTGLLFIPSGKSFKLLNCKITQVIGFFDGVNTLYREVSEPYEAILSESVNSELVTDTDRPSAVGNGLDGGNWVSSSSYRLNKELLLPETPNYKSQYQLEIRLQLPENVPAGTVAVSWKTNFSAIAQVRR